MNLFSHLQNIGVRPEYSEYVNNKVKISNLVAFFNIALVALPFVFISLQYAPSVIFIPVLGIIAMAFVWVFNNTKLIYLARIISAITPLLLAALYTAHLSSPNGELPLVMVLICLGFSILPFLVFDIREKSYLLFSATINFLVFSSLNGLATFFTEDIDNGFITTGFLYQLNFIISILLAYVIVFLLAFIGFKAELKSRQLIENNTKQNEELKESEDKLKENLKEVRKAQEEEKNRAWVTEGLSTINTLTRVHNNLSHLCKEVISEIVKYIGANQGAIYLVEANEEELEPLIEMKAAFAYGRKKAVIHKVRPGEGLIGQCYLDKDMIFLTEIPENYMKIKSGLGDANPRNVIILPLLTNDKVEGIIEIASFKILAEHKIDYLRKLGESLATSFSLNKINANTKHLLELSQEQEEQMRSQAEELHQNMEELQATQEEMTRKNRETEEQNQQLQQQEEELRQNMEELSAQAEEMERHMKQMQAMQGELQARENILNETTIISEADLYGTITYVNEKLVEVAKYSREEMLGKPHSIFRHPDTPSVLFEYMWKTIKAGKVFRGIIKNQAKDGTIYWVDATISPVLDEHNKPVKFIGVRFVIEEESVALKLFADQSQKMGWN